MFRSNSFRMSLLFLGIIFFAILARIYLLGDGIIIKNDKSFIANVLCNIKDAC